MKQFNNSVKAAETINAANSNNAVANMPTLFSDEVNLRSIDAFFPLLAAKKKMKRMALESNEKKLSLVCVLNGRNFMRLMKNVEIDPKNPFFFHVTIDGGLQEDMSEVLSWGEKNLQIPEPMRVDEQYIPIYEEDWEEGLDSLCKYFQ